MDLAALEIFRHVAAEGSVTRAAERLGRVSEWAGMWATRRSGSTWMPVVPSRVPASIPAHFNAEQRRDAERLLGVAFVNGPASA